MTTKTRAAATPTAGWRNRITGAGEEAPGQLLANPANWRIHPKAQQDALAGALDQLRVLLADITVDDAGLASLLGDLAGLHAPRRTRAAAGGVRLDPRPDNPGI